MKFVAKRDFFNASELGLKPEVKKDKAGQPVLADGKPVSLWEHPLHIPKGARFNVGTLADGSDSPSLEEMTKESDKTLAKKLIMFQCVVVDDGTSKTAGAIKALDLEVASETKADADAPKARSIEVVIAEATTKAITEALAPVLGKLADAIAGAKK